MQGKLPCNNCPWGYKCEKCVMLQARKNSKLRDSHKKGGFFSKSLVSIKGTDGKEHFHYLNQE